MAAGYLDLLQQNAYTRPLINYIFPGKCLEKFFVDFDFLNQKCAPILISRLLGVAITLGSSFLLVPQILKIHNAKSGQGISLAAQLLGLVSAAGSAAYSYEKGFVFGQWGDSLFVALQTMVIVMQILYFSNRSAYAFAFGSCCWSVFTAVLYHYVPIEVLRQIQASTVPIVFLSKGIQVVTNCRQGGTGQLSIISVVMQFGGCVARVFTSVQETGGDWLVITPFIVASVLNGIILAQIIYYSRFGKEQKKKSKDKKRQ